MEKTSYKKFVFKVDRTCEDDDVPDRSQQQKFQIWTAKLQDSVQIASRVESLGVVIFDASME